MNGSKHRGFDATASGVSPDHVALTRRRAHLGAVFSDGGSNQEELSYLGVPTILYRERSERPDGLGRNIVLRGDVDESMDEFIGSGRIDALRSPSRIDDDVQPSQMTVAALDRWGGGGETTAAES